MATIVFVHGAWTGGWIWRDVAARLRAEGYDVYTPTLTGLGERVHLGGPDVDLDTHITDIINVLSYEDLDDVVLVGHSYSGIVVEGVADRAPDRLAGLVYVDCAPLSDGMALFNLFGDEGRAATEQVANEYGDGWKLPFPSIEDLGNIASIAGLDDAALDLMTRRGTPQPIGTYRQPLSLTHEFDGEYTRSLVACSLGDFSVEWLKSGIASGEPMLEPISAPDWTFYELETGHWPMLSEPEELSEIMIEIVNRS
ncbi:MAG: alpha/beta hydrolase [Thermomicrobiales bacterium]